MIHNTYEAIQVLPGIFKDLGELFKSKTTKIIPAWLSS